MKGFLIRLAVAAAVVLVVSLASPGHAQQAGDNSGLGNAQSQATTPSSPQPSATPSHEGSATATSDSQTEDALAFSGQVVREKGHIVLNDPVTKMSYQLDDQSKAKPYVGKQVKVTGKLELNNNTIHIDRIEPLS